MAGKLDKANEVKRARKERASLMTEVMVKTREGFVPLDVCYRAMREMLEAADKLMEGTAERIEMLQKAAAVAKDAAPYIHAKLATITHEGGDKPIVHSHVYVPGKSPFVDADVVQSAGVLQ